MILALVVASCTSVTRLPGQPAPTELVDGIPAFEHGAFEHVLARFVDAAGGVDYAALCADGAELDRYLGQLGGASPDSHPALFPTREHALAYWINAYNAIVLDVVCEHYPVESVLDIRAAHGVFRRIAYPLGGVPMTLDDIEKGVLLAAFDEPRVHFALTCGARGCPRLDRTAFGARGLDTRLDDEARAFLRSPRGVQIDAEGNEIRLSRYFDWYAEDFGPDARAYVRRYLDDDARARLDTLAAPTVVFLDYDWGLNDSNRPD